MPVVIIPVAGPQRGGRVGNERAFDQLTSGFELADLSRGDTVYAVYNSARTSIDAQDCKITGSATHRANDHL